MNSPKPAITGKDVFADIDMNFEKLGLATVAPKEKAQPAITPQRPKHVNQIVREVLEAVV